MSVEIFVRWTGAGLGMALALGLIIAGPAQAGDKKGEAEESASKAAEKAKEQQAKADEKAKEEAAKAAEKAKEDKSNAAEDQAEASKSETSEDKGMSEDAKKSSGSGDGLEVGSTLCALSDIGPGAGGCAGFYEGNLNGGSPDKLAASADALNTLLGVDTFTGDKLTILADLSGDDFVGSQVNFGTLLYGMTVVSFHVGAAKGQDSGVGYNATAFYKFDAGTEGLKSFDFNRAGLSNARLYATGSAPPPCLDGCGAFGAFGGTAVPEPTAWALMIIGFGGVGAVLRRRRMLGATA